MSWKFCVSGAAINKAGANANSTITADASTLDSWSDEVEDYLCVLARYDLITNYDSLTAKGKEILQQYETAAIAQNIINYEPEAIGRQGATLRLNILENQKTEVKVLLKDDKFRTYLGAK